MEEKKLLVFDIDGTLMTSNHQILRSTRQALTEALSRGHYVSLASARPPASVARICIEVGAVGIAAVALNGALIIQPGAGRKVIWEDAMDPDSVWQLTAAAREKRLQVNLLSGWQWYVEKMDRWAEEEARIIELQPTVVSRFETQVTSKVHKFLAIGEPQATAEFGRWANASELGVFAALSKPTYCEVVRSGVSKAQAVLRVAKLLSVAEADVIAFGDGANDLPMMEAAGIGVAMGNSPAEVAAKADFVTKSNDEDGIAYALKYLRII